MRLLRCDVQGIISLTKDLVADIPDYTILSHTWSEHDEDEVTFSDLQDATGRQKEGWAKLRFCAEQARQDGGLEHFWVDTCCINKANYTELSEAITSMFRWYRGAAKCYVCLSNVSVGNCKHDSTPSL